MCVYKIYSDYLTLLCYLTNILYILYHGYRERERERERERAYCIYHQKLQEKTCKQIIPTTLLKCTRCQLHYRLSSKCHPYQLRARHCIKVIDCFVQADIFIWQGSWLIRDRMEYLKILEKFMTNSSQQNQMFSSSIFC